VSVDNRFGPGKVKVTMSFADWKKGNVVDATYHLDLPGKK
jgi:hypothetical protein